ncbi:MAG: PAS domain S-box protein [Candidatus Cloacimonetes bacterium]|nr:PAS domain S-box protein [Candidatus Cloacimonadota bacterium]
MIIKILMLEDSPSDTELAEIEFRKAKLQYTLKRVETREDFVNNIIEDKPDLIIADYSLPAFDGISALEIAKEIIPNVPFIIFTGSLDEMSAVDVMRNGAWDYVLKENTVRLVPAIQNALKLKAEKDKNKLIEEKIRKLSKVVETTPAAIVITDLQGKIEYVNQGLLTLGGFEDDSLIIGKSIFMFSNEEGVEQLQKNIIPTILSENKWIGEVPVKRKDCSIFQAEIICSVILDEEDKPKYLLSQYNDITDRKKVEAQNIHLTKVIRNVREINRLIIYEKDRMKLLQNVTEILSNNLDYSNAMILTFDKDQKYEFLIQNEIGEDYLSVKEMFKKGIYSSCIKQALNQEELVIIDTPLNECEQCTFRIYDNDFFTILSKLSYGSRTYGVISLQRTRELVLNDEELGLLKEVANDIAFALYRIDLEEEHKVFEKHIKKQAKTLDQIFHNSIDSMVLLDKDYNYISVSDSFAKSCHREKKDYFNQNHFDLYPSDLKEKADKAKKDKQIYRRYSHSFVFPKNPEWGTSYWDLGLIPLLDNNDEVEMFLLTLKEVTDNIIAIRQLRESEKKLRNFIDFSPMGIWCFQPKKPVSINISQDQMISKFFNSICVDCNDTYANMMNISTENIIGLKLSDAMPDIDENRNYLKAFINNGFKLLDGISREYTKDGKEKYFSNSLVGVIKNGELINAWGTQTDITNRINAEEKLKKSEKKYRDLFEKSKDAILIIHNGKFIDCNQATIDMLRYNNKDEFLNKHLSELSPEKQPDGKMSLSKINEMMKIALKNGSHRFEWDHKRADGEIFPVEVLLTAISNDKKNQIIHTVWRDITESKQAEEHIRKLSSAVEQSPSIIAITDLNSNIEYMNPIFYEITGYTPEEVLGHDFKILRSDEFSETYYKEIWEIVVSGKTWKGVFSNKKKNGEIYYEAATIAPILDKKGKQTHYLKVAENITEQRLIEQALKSSEERLRTLINNTDDIICFKDSEGKWLEANQAILKLYQLENVEFFGKTDCELAEFSDFYRESFLVCDVTDKTAWQAKKPTGKDEVIPLPNGSSKIYHIIKVPLFNKDGARKGLIVIGHDITKRKMIEKQLRQDLEEKKVLLKEIHHRVKNNMQIIASLLKAQSRFIKNEENRSIFENSLNRVKTMALVHEKLYMHKNLAHINLPIFIRSLILNILSTNPINPRKIKIIEDIADIDIDVNMAIPCGLIINELVSNSLQHAFPNDSMGNVMIRFNKIDGFYIFTIKDDGIGILDDSQINCDSSFGLLLVNSLIKQLHGLLTIVKQEGIEYTIKFKPFAIKTYQQINSKI